MIASLFCVHVCLAFGVSVYHSVFIFPFLFKDECDQCSFWFFFKQVNSIHYFEVASS